MPRDLATPTLQQFTVVVPQHCSLFEPDLPCSALLIYISCLSPVGIWVCRFLFKIYSIQSFRRAKRLSYHGVIPVILEQLASCPSAEHTPCQGSL